MTLDPGAAMSIHGPTTDLRDRVPLRPETGNFARGVLVGMFAPDRLSKYARIYARSEESRSGRADARHHREACSRAPHVRRRCGSIGAVEKGRCITPPVCDLVMRLCCRGCETGRLAVIEKINQRQADKL